jgi:predicted nucleic acid-binding Zn ribbon protein
MKPVTPIAVSASDRAALERIRHRRRANQFTIVACLIAAAIAVALGMWLPTLAK